MVPSKPQPKTSSKAAGKAADAAADAAGPEAKVAEKVLQREAAKTGARQAKAKKTAGKAAKTTGKALVSGNRSMQGLKAEWLAGILLIFGYPLAKPGAFNDFNFWVSRLMAWSVAYLILMLMASVGPRAARLANAFGLLVLLALMLAPFDGGTFGAKILGDSVARLGGRPTENAQPGLNVQQWLNQLLSPAAPPPQNGLPLPLVRASATTPVPTTPQTPPVQSV